MVLGMRVSLALLAAGELFTVERPDLALDIPFVAVHLEESLGEGDRLLHRLGFEDRVAADHLLGLGERPLGHGELAEARAHLHAFVGAAQPRGPDERAVAGHLFDQLAISVMRRSLGFCPDFSSTRTSERNRIASLLLGVWVGVPSR